MKNKQTLFIIRMILLLIATTLDLSSFYTSSVKHMLDMFASSTNLKTIYVSENFTTDEVYMDTVMFENCTNLIGGASTKYDSNNVTAEYVHIDYIDGEDDWPGYFTDIVDKK